MSLQHLQLKSLSDTTWIDKYIHEMGERSFWGYRRWVYDSLDNLKVGEWISVDKWANAEKIDLFVKLCCCYISETNYDYEFNADGTILKHKFDRNSYQPLLDRLKAKKYETMVHSTEEICV